MEMCETNTDSELSNIDFEQNTEKILSLAQKCLSRSRNDTEILNALKISFKLCLKIYSVDELEREVFFRAGPAAKRFVFMNLEQLENTTNFGDSDSVIVSRIQLITTCSEIISHIKEFFVQLNEIPKCEISQLQSLLVNSVEILHRCFCHCNDSEKVYGSDFESVSQCLTSCFKKSCELLDLILLYLSDKLNCTFEDPNESTIFCTILKWLSQCGIVLMNLDVKMMAKVWKTHVFLIEKYINQVRDFIDIGSVIRSLSEAVLTSVISAQEMKDGQEFSRQIKLACFNMKLVIKFCEVFNGSLTNCYKSILNLLFILCRINIEQQEGTKTRISGSEDLLKQLSFGVDPLLSHLISDKLFVDEFAELEHIQRKESISLVLVFCFILRKLMHQSMAIRSLWFNKDQNILNWLFHIITLNQYELCMSKKLPEVLIENKQREVYDLYQHVLISVSSFGMTSTAKEFFILEKILIQNVLQPNTLSALLATDIWCILARFSGSDLCLAQITRLSQMSKEFEYDSFRIEKSHLAFLIYRLYPLLTKSHRNIYVEMFQTSLRSEMWKNLRLCRRNEDFDPYLIDDANSPLLCYVEKFLQEEKPTFDIPTFNMENSCSDEKNASKRSVQNQVVELWKFDVSSLLNCCRKEKFIKIICSLTLEVLPHLSTENMLMIFSKLKQILVQDDSTVIQLYAADILNGLSLITFPQNDFQRRMVETIAEIFQLLLQSEKCLVREKAMEVFYDFSHATSHAEIISLSVNNLPGLKCDVANYFKKIVSSRVNVNVDDFLLKLCDLECPHECFPNGRAFDGNSENFHEETNFSEGTALSNERENEEKIRGTLKAWKKNGEALIGYQSQLINSEKNEISEMCTRLLSLIR